MRSTSDATLLLRTAIPPLVGLIHCKSLAQVDHFGSLLPSAFSIGAFECRLTDSDDRVDYTLCIRDDPAARLMLLTSELAGSAVPPSWRDVRRRLARWAMRTDRSASPVVWLEIDAPSSDAAAEECSPFLVHTLREATTDDVEVRIRETRALVADALELGPTDPMLDGIAALVRRLPQWCAVRHVAMRPGGRTLRAVCRMPCTRAREFAAGGPGSPVGQAMDRLARGVFGHAAVTNVNLDLTPELGPRVGLEFHFAGTPEEDSRWTILFDELERTGLLARRKREVLARWPSPATDRDLDLVSPDTLVRDLMIKVDFDATGPVMAKAYFPFGPAKFLRQTGRPGTMAAA